MYVASDSSEMLQILWHRHCNKAVLCFVKHRETRIVAVIFEGAPAEVTQHRRNAVIGGKLFETQRAVEAYSTQGLTRVL